MVDEMNWIYKLPPSAEIMHAIRPPEPEMTDAEGKDSRESSPAGSTETRDPISKAKKASLSTGLLKSHSMLRDVVNDTL
jgi:hypothetical protein